MALAAGCSLLRTQRCSEGSTCQRGPGEDEQDTGRRKLEARHGAAHGEGQA